jgi:hypothetical protein
MPQIQLRRCATSVIIWKSQSGDQAAVARAWLDLARYLREQENSIPSVPHPSEPGKRIHPDAFTG